MTALLRSSLGLLSLCLVTASSLYTPVIAHPIPSFFLAQNTNSSSNQLTEESIRTVLSSLDKARKNKDINSFLSHIAPFAHSTITTDVDGDVVIINIEGTDGHREFLRGIYQEVKDRKILNQQVDIRITKDGQMGIVIIREQIEYNLENGSHFISDSLDTLRFGLVDGKPMVVSATLKGWLSSTP